MNALRLLPSWVWWLATVLIVGGVQQYRVWDLQGDFDKQADTLEARTTERDTCRTTRESLERQVGEQNLALSDLREQAAKRQIAAQQAQANAREQAQNDYQAANRLQQERIGGDACAAAESVIDLELGL